MVCIWIELPPLKISWFQRGLLAIGGFLDGWAGDLEEIDSPLFPGGLLLFLKERCLLKE